MALELLQIHEDPPPNEGPQGGQGHWDVAGPQEPL